MGTGYTRNDASNNIADGNVINASDLDGEFDAVQSAFNGSSGHSHDGTTGEGPLIAAGGLASDAVTTAKILDANVTLAKMAVNSVDSDQYVDGSIDTAHIGNLQVTTAKIAADAIDGTKIADDAIDSEHYVDGSIDTAHIADAQVTLAKIADQGANSVLVRDANSSGVVSAKAVGDTQLLIGDGTGFTAAALSGDVTMANTGAVAIGAQKVVNSMLADDAVGADELAADAVVTASIVDANVTTAKIADANVTTAKIAGDAITGAKIADDAIDSEHYTDGSIDTAHIAADAVTNAKIADDSIDSEHYVDGSIDTAHIADDAVTSAKLDTNIQVAGTLGVTGETTLTTHLNMGDNDIIKLGDSADLQIYHDGSNSFIKDAGDGGIFMRATNNIKMESADGNRVLAEFTDSAGADLYYNNSKKLATQSGGIDITGELQSDSLDVDGVGNISGTLTMGSNVDFPDGSGTRYGASNDLQIYHDGSDSYISDTGTGNLRILAENFKVAHTNNSEAMINANIDGAVELYYDSSKKIETTSSGISVTGDVIGSNGLFGLDSTDYIQFVDNSHIRFISNGSEEFRMEADGDFHADGDVIAFSTTVSDERLKTDIEKIENATDKVSQLNGYTFTYKADGKKSAGVIAQEVEKVLPSAVSEKELPLKIDDGVAYKTVQYDQIIGLLVESIKELKQEINELKGE